MHAAPMHAASARWKKKIETSTAESTISGGVCAASATPEEGSSRVARKRTTGKRYTVFISHSTKDRWIARQISQEIERRGRRFGVETFLDEKDIQGGDSFSDTIFPSIHNCKEFLVLMSPSSVTRGWVLMEIGAALGFRKRVVALMLNVEFNQLPDPIISNKAMELNDFDQYLDQLIDRVRGTGIMP